MNKLILFDIDKTLVTSSKAHHKAFSEAFLKVYGVDTTIDIINSHGMTEQQIIIEVLKKNGLDEQTIKSKLQECMKVMIDSFNKNIDNDEIIMLDGVKELLEELKNNVLMGLVTGNLEPIARGKLKKVGINHYFKVGGFGEDDINRTNLVKIAIKRAEENFDFTCNNNVFLIGDAPQDMKAEREAGVETIGVTTGIYSKEQLEDAGADFVVESLKDKNKILEILLK
ncbi:MAG: HAD family hydrolase [Patescibacteria group bacterium]|nr:HAD family hydrolase [Patescibacteria group bacterium]